MKTFKIKNKEELLNAIKYLEVKADIYCRTDWTRYLDVISDLKILNAKLLDIYTCENEAFLQSHVQ